MGSKRKPAFVLANRDHFTSMLWADRKAYRDKVLVSLHAKHYRLTQELIAHLARLRVKHEVINKNAISIFPDADNWELRNKHVGFSVMFFSWPSDVPNGRLRLTFLKSLESQSPGWFRVNKVPILEPKYDNYQVWHYKGGYCQVLEDELVLERPPHDDVKDAVANAMEELIPPSHNRGRSSVQRPSLQFHSRFGGVAH